MTLILIIVAAIGIVWLAERSAEHFALAMAAQSFCAAVLLFAVGDLERAVLLSSFVALAVFGASSVKYTHSGRKLVVADLPLAFAGTAPFFLVQYPLAVAAVVAGGITLILAAVATLYLPGPAVAPAVQILVFGIALIGLIVAYRSSGGAVALQRIAAQRRCFLSSFVASLLDPLSWRAFGGLALSDIARDPAAADRRDTGPQHRLSRHHRDPARVDLRSARLRPSRRTGCRGLPVSEKCALWQSQRRYFRRRIVAIRIQPADRPFQRQLRLRCLFSFQARRRPIP